jgi:hypothetical protein
VGKGTTAVGSDTPDDLARLRGSMTYRIVPTNDDDTENDWRCSTRSYMYALEHVGTGQQIAAWHWHPHTTFTNPHLHIGSSQLGRPPR